MKHSPPPPVFFSHVRSGRVCGFVICFGLAVLPRRATAEMPAATPLPMVEVSSRAVKLDHWLTIGPFGRLSEKQTSEEAFLRQMVGDAPMRTSTPFDLKHWLATGAFASNREKKPASLAPRDTVASMIAWLQHSGIPAASSVLGTTASTRMTVMTGRDLINLPYALGLGELATADTDDGVDPSMRPTAGLYYCACVVHSSKPATAYLMVGCDSPFMLSLNGAQIAADAKSRVLRLWDYSYLLELAAGDNLLLLRVDSREGDPGVFAARLEPTKEAASRTALDDTDGLSLSTMVLTAGQSLSIRVRGAPSRDLLPAEILDFDDHLIAQAGLVGNPPKKWSSAGVAPGLYKVRIRYEGATFEKLFYIMKPGAKFQDLMSGLDWSHLKLTEEQRIDLMALQRRMEILCRPEHWLPAEDEWQRKIAYTLGEIRSIVEKIKQGHEPIKGVPGIHLRGFVSAIDGQTEYYRLFVPSGYRAGQSGGLPIILIMPTNTSNPRPFIESVFVAHQIEADTLAALAEKKGCALLWVGFRCQPKGTPCEFAHFDEVLNAVKQDYRIDDRRIYLMGECGGGALALMYNVRYPGRFAATALINSLFHRFQHADNNKLWPLPAYRRWAEENDPVTAVLQQRPSLLVMHDGTAEEGHGLLSYSLDFAAEAKAAGFQFAFDQFPPTLHYHLEAWSNMLAWLLPQRLDDQRKVQSAPSSSRLGPISRAFAGPFILVEGTGGNARDQTGMQALGKSFLDTWQRVHYGQCRFAKDRDLSDSDKAAYNLILLGNASTNSVWSKIESRVPAKIAPDGIVLGAKKWSGPGLSVQALLRNPYNPARLVVVIGGSDLSSAGFGTMNLSIEGWYDFAIWQTRAGDSKLVVADSYAEAANPRVASIQNEDEPEDWTHSILPAHPVQP